ncbi:MAG: GNAT family N-acetyltransferase [archaeon]|nr:GNAT family N-acetyltransferase [archaeon]
MLIGKMVQLIPSKKEYIEKYQEWLTNREVTQYLSIYNPITIEMEEDWYRNMQKNNNMVHFTIIDGIVKNSLKPIGVCSIDIDWKNRVGSVGIVIGEKDYWNKGYGTESLDLLVDYGFNTLNLNRIELDVYDHNLRAQKSYKKVGFIEEGRRRSAMFLNGKYRDAIIMSILKDERN